MNILKNQFGLVALAVAILIAAFVFFGSDRANERDVVAPLDGESAAVENEESRAPASTQTAPKPAASKPAPAPAPTPSASGLNGSTFRLTSHNGSAIPGGGIYTVTFTAGNATFEDGFINAKFCSTLTAPYRVKSGVISADLTGARMYCETPAGVMDLEAALVRLIDGGSRMTLQGNYLTLTDSIQTLVFVRQ